MTESQTTKLPQYVAAIAAGGGALALGALQGWSSPAELSLLAGEYGFPISKEQFSWIGSSLTLGSAFTCIPVGFMITLIGRKTTMLLLVVPFIIGWVLMIWASNVATMLLARIILGMAGGAFCVATPMYTAEIADTAIRGRLGSSFQLMLTAGILFSYCAGAFLEVFWLSVACSMIPLIFGTVLIFMPESPTYLVSMARYEKAVSSIQWLRGKDYNYGPEIEELKETAQKLKENSVTIAAALKRPVTIKAMGLSLGLVCFQQLSGINAVIFYSAKIFEDAETGMNPKLCTVAVGTMHMSSTLVSAIVVDKLGRRVLLLISSVMMAIVTCTLGIYFYLQQQDRQNVASVTWLPVVSLCMFVIMFSIGFGPVTWLMLGELFAADIKGVAGSFACTVNYLLAFLVTKTFVNFGDTFGTAQTFWIFACISIIGFFFVLTLIPETKGKSLNEVQRMLEGDLNQRQSN